ncbi:MAG: dihydrolipoamide acetyltransferase family protein, partial [Planococcaceae bacterium]|nr:dihydrolipoamide acetyltransferase family protein [Planococcaceae bacterium]
MLEVKLHDIGEGMTEGEIIHYLVKVGDTVKTDQPLVEVQTDKMVAELTSPCSGVIKEIIIEAGETVHVGTSLIYIEADDKTSNKEHAVQPKVAKETLKQSVQPKVESTATSISSFNRVLAAPYTRKIAREHDINIEDVKASDPSGRVTEEDVYRFINGNQSSEQTEVASNQKSETTDVSNVTPDEIPFKGIRKKIAEKMTKSLFTIPHVTHFDEINMTNLFKMREEMKVTGESVSVSAFLVKALVICLKDFPIFNAELDEENSRILLKKNYHIGMATNTEAGLIV